MPTTLSLLLPLAGILAGARGAALLSRRLGFPAVFGELILGFLVGPALLNLLQPSELIHFLADIGVILLMFLAGLETDLHTVRSVGRAAALAALGGVILPLAGGFALGIGSGIPARNALFLGAVLTATSVSVSVQTLRDLGKLNSPQGAAILSAAIIDDLLGVIVFAIVMSLESGSPLLTTLLRMSLFLPAAWIAGNWLLPRLLQWEKRSGHREASLGIVVALVLLYAWAAEALGSVATITGAYILGTIVGRHIDESHPIHQGISALSFGFFVPVFFVNIGLQARLDGFLASPVLTLGLTGIATISKIIGSGLGARLGGMSAGQALQVGCGMVSRGEVALVIAGAGMAGGLLDSTIFSILILVTLTTTLITPPLLRLAANLSSLRSLRFPSLPVANWRDYCVDEQPPSFIPSLEETS
ncbi:Kef-type K+ transport systems, membrane components [Anaerolinea thermolimosa]|uniref:cation:proton antiporter n=1 Tax=Anaerolinea thermolimosa TaxID=229919 RepID=UPI0007815ABB|nr:cation:proton antiporter [Anaerolinea thermolimosa]GAP07185.1 Kef-type K+ transport systems, membrane components [Anaerolinea thermolimosa]